MKQLIQKCWNDFQKAKTLPFVIPNSIPILWFGDLNAYKKSDLKIVTVGINPSDVEFKLSARSPASYNTSYRFPLAQILVNNPSLNGSDIKQYASCMNAYFTNTDKHNDLTWYKPWFGKYEAALNGLDASYTGSYKRTAIHIDLCSPVATTKWSDLSSNQKVVLQSCASFSFNDLVKKLNPQVIITCVNRNLIKNNYINQYGNPCNENNADFIGPIIDSYIRAYHLNNGRILIWGKNGRTGPFVSQCKADVTKIVTQIRNQFSLP